MIAGAKYILCLMIVSVTGVEAMSEIPQSDTGPASDQRVKQAIQMLWSQDSTARELGRNEILRIGSATAKPLIGLLSDLIRNKSPRFAVGKDEEGRQALNDYVELFRKTRQSVHDTKEDQTLSRLAINSRLISDAISLLGELRAVEAIPILIYIMENTMNLPSNAFGIEMEALRNIGAPAVPFLIKSIENANISAAEYEPFCFGFEIEIDLGDRESANQQDNSELDDPDLEKAIEWIASKIKGKVITVLGEIGDKDALPYLQNLAKTVDDERLVHDIFRAIKRIKNEPSTSIGPQFPEIVRKPKPRM